jgi:hypothetical protein
MTTFNFQSLIVGDLKILAKSNDFVKAYLDEKQNEKKTVMYTVKEYIELKGKIGKVLVLEIPTIANTLLCWGGIVRAPMCSLIALYNSLLLKGVKMTQSQFFEIGVKVLPTEGFLVGDHFIENVFNRLKEKFITMKEYELIICNREDVKLYSDLGMIGKNSVLVWNCNKDTKDKGEHFTAAVFNAFGEEEKIKTLTTSNKHIDADILLARKIHEHDLTYIKTLQEEQDAIRKMFPNGW